MRVNGEWLECDDGVIRPSIPGFVRAPDRKMIEVIFLLDAGADRTVLSSRFLYTLQSLATTETEQIHLAGVGGEVDSITVHTVVGFMRDNGQLVTVRGAFGVFTLSESSEMSVLGRDVTNNFDVIYSFPRREVILLGPPHGYQVQHPS
jgi:hypothetical protein